MSTLSAKELRELLLEYFVENFGDRQFSVKLKDVAEEFGEDYQRVVNHVNTLIRRGELERPSGPQQGSTPVLRVPKKLEDCSHDANKYEITKQEDVQAREDFARVDEFFNFNFEDKTTRIIRTDSHGYVVPIPDIANAVGIRPSSLYQFINRNYDGFEGMVVEVSTNPDPEGKRTTRALTRKGITMYLQKADATATKPEVREKIVQFQRWTNDKVDTLITEGEVKLSGSEHNQIVQQLQEITQISDEDLAKVMTSFIQQVNDLVTSKLESAEQDAAKLEREKQEAAQRASELEEQARVLSERAKYWHDKADEYSKTLQRIKVSAKRK